MRVYAIMKENVDAVMKARGIPREELSRLCHKEKSWASKIFNDPKRWFPMPYWDRICNLLGLSPYQLLQPGISTLTERRKGQRRSGQDRRLSAVNHHVRESVSQMIAGLSEADVATLIRWRALGREGAAMLREALEAAERSAREGAGQRRRPRSAETAADTATGSTTHDVRSPNAKGKG